MDVLTLSSSNFTGISSNYPYDDTLSVITDNYTSYDGINVSIIDGLCSAVDTSTNYYSAFVLSNRGNINDIIEINTVQQTYPYSLTTYLGLYTTGDILPESRVVVTAINDVVSAVSHPINFVSYNNNINLINYTINYLSPDTCTITQKINAVEHYLSYYQSNTGLGAFLMVEGYQTDEVNLFNYVYDTDLSQLVLMKKVNGLQKYVSYGSPLGCLSLVDFVTGADVFINSSAFKVRNYSINDLLINSDWYSYVKNIDVDGLDVNNDRSVNNLPINYLINFTFEKLQNNAIPLNIIPLKNDKDNENSLSRGSIINQDYDGVLQRNYTSLNTGTTQTKGSPDFNNTYSTFTTQLLVPTDNITFFYFPYQPFPVIKLNINDSSLVNSGAIAGDKPVNSDKVFKHKVKEQFSAPFNNSNSEQTGTYLCSWLKGGNSLSALPVWVDRYYNPSLINTIDALTYTNTYQTDFNLLAVNNPDNVQFPIYDITSNLTFEPGYQYAIQHLGDKNIVELIDSLSGNLIEKYINNKYDYLNQYYEYVGNEIILGVNNYSKLLDETLFQQIKEYNTFTISFDLSVKRWDERIGYQIFGNFNNSGIGIFNDQQITPFVITYDSSVITIYNSELTLLDTVDVDSNIVHLVKLDPVGNMLTITADNVVTRVDYNSVITDKNIIDNISQYVSFYSTLEYTYCYTPGLSTIKIDNWSLDVTGVTEKFIDIIVPNVAPLVYNIVVLDEIIYNIPGTNVKSLNGKIFFTARDGDGQDLIVYDIVKNQSSILFVADALNDYVINEDGTIYVLYNNNSFLLTDTEYRIQYSNNFPIQLFTNQSSLSGLTYKGFDFIENIDGTGIAEEAICFVGFDTINNIKHLVRTNKIVDGSLVSIQNSTTQSVSGVTGFRNITNYNFNHNNLTTTGELEFRLGLPNVYDRTQTKLLRYFHDITGLEPGYHNFVLRFDSVNGVYTIFIDGVKAYETVFNGGQYSFSNVINKQLYIGNCIYYNNLPLGFYTKQTKYYLTGTIGVKNLYIYKAALSFYDILLHFKLNYPVSDLRFELPTGKRNFVETIQQFFKFKVPGFKSNYFNVNIVNLPATGDLKTQLDKTFIEIINKNKPGYTQLNTITYHE